MGNRTVTYFLLPPLDSFKWDLAVICPVFLKSIIFFKLTRGNREKSSRCNIRSHEESKERSKGLQAMSTPGFWDNTKSLIIKYFRFKPRLHKLKSFCLLSTVQVLFLFEMAHQKYIPLLRAVQFSYTHTSVLVTLSLNEQLKGILQFLKLIIFH